MSEVSRADLEATQRVLQAVDANPSLLQQAPFAFLVSFVHKHQNVTLNQTSEPTAKNESEEEEEHDPDRWILPKNATAKSAPGFVDPRLERDQVEDPTEEEMDEAMDLRRRALAAAANSNFEEAVKLITDAIRKVPNKAIFWAQRAEFYYKLKEPMACVHDATAALETNPENAKALRVRGMCYAKLGQWDAAAVDLHAAQRVDYDENLDTLVKKVEEHVCKRREKQRRAEEAKRAKAAEEAKRAAQPSSSSGAGAAAGPGAGAGGGFPGGMGGMPPGMGDLLNDPEIAQAFQDPEVASKLSTLMSNPMAALQYMSDPKLGPIMQKIMQKAMAGGMPGMPGMGGMGGMGGGAKPSSSADALD